MAQGDRSGIELQTPSGLARVHLHRAANGVAGLVLGHGAGGGITAPDLAGAAKAALAHDVSVALVEQPYRVAGRKSPAPAKHLDAAWTAVLERLASRELSELPLIVGGRSSGARVACRTASDTRAAGVLCLAFPLIPPRRTGPPAESRLPELESVPVPTLVVQGVNDRFGVPPGGPNRTVVQVPGDHSLRTDPEAVAKAVEDWLPTVVAARAPLSASR